jgi:hypothetical protein
MGTIAEPEQIAAGICFLASNEAARAVVVGRSIRATCVRRPRGWVTRTGS